MSNEIDPRLVFERLFGGDSQKDRVARAERQELKKSLLDYVRDDARRLQD